MEALVAHLVLVESVDNVQYNKALKNSPPSKKNLQVQISNTLMLPSISSLHAKMHVQDIKSQKIASQARLIWGFSLSSLSVQALWLRFPPSSRPPLTQPPNKLAYSESSDYGGSCEASLTPGEDPG
jgi:hypothetical protein